MNKRTLNPVWALATIIYTGGIGVILYLAYTRGIPSEIAYIPYYDIIGHFVLYGIWAYLADRSLNSHRIKELSTAALILSAITILEEYLQNFSLNRTFSLVDLAFSLAGIWLAVNLHQLRTIRKHSEN